MSIFIPRWKAFHSRVNRKCGNKMSLNDDVKEAMRVAIAGGTFPKRGRSNQTTLNMKRNPGRSSYVLLARADVSLTKAGKYYYGQNPSQIRPTSQFDYNTPIIKRGPNDYIRTKDGKESLIRSLKADGSTSVTGLGRSFFQKQANRVYCTSSSDCVRKESKR